MCHSGFSLSLSHCCDSAVEYGLKGPVDTFWTVEITIPIYPNPTQFVAFIRVTCHVPDPNFTVTCGHSHHDAHLATGIIHSPNMVQYFSANIGGP
jgi:hypothetical protein